MVYWFSPMPVLRCGSILKYFICSNNNENNENRSVAQLLQQHDEHSRHHDQSRNFALAYIYYWMEVDAITFNIIYYCLFTLEGRCWSEQAVGGIVACLSWNVSCVCARGCDWMEGHTMLVASVEVLTSLNGHAGLHMQ